MAVNRALVVRFDCYHQDGLDYLKRLEDDGIIDVKFRICTNDINDDKYFPNSENIIFAFHILEDNFDGDIDDFEMDMEFYNKFQKYLELFVYQQSRFSNEKFFFGNFQNLREVRSDINLFYRLIRYYYCKIMHHKIDVVLFDEVPHHSHTLLLYNVARELGVKTVMHSPSIFSNKSFCVNSIKQMDYLLENGCDFSKKIIDLPHDKSKSVDLFYYQGELKNFWINNDHFLNRISYLRKNRNKKAISALKYSLLYYLGFKGLSRKKMEVALDKFCFFARKFCNLSKAYKLYREMEVDIKSLDEKYIYFPLHFEPEASTVPLGGMKYFDQLKAIEDLQHKVKGTNVKIYVKEHPANHGGNRSYDFYKRLKNIPNTYFINQRFDSFSLINNSICVASITGNSIYESLCSRKPVISFGHYWCNSVSGVFRFNKIENIEDVFSFRFNDELFFDDLRLLSRKLCDITPTWSLKKEFWPEGFDLKKNMDEFSKVIKIAINGDE